MRCKITDKKIKPFMSFGKMPAANGFLEKKDFKSEFFYNMEVGFSEKISLFQLNNSTRDALSRPLRTEKSLSPVTAAYLFQGQTSWQSSHP